MKTLNAVGFIQSFIKDLVSSLLKKGISDPAVISALVEMTSKELGLDKDLVIELIYKELCASA